MQDKRRSITHLIADLPESLEGLVELAADLRWTWSHAGDELWNSLDTDIWELTKNPYVILQSISQQRLQELAEDTGFTQRLKDVLKERKRYLERKGWFPEYFPDSRLKGVAYFSMEFGIGEALPLYAGGLGILAGDYLKSASDLQVPVVGIGLLYQQGYFRQMLDSEGWQQEFYPLCDPSTLPVEPVYRNSGEWLQVSIELPGRSLLLRVWQARVGKVTLYLLDSNHPLNTPVDRGITAQLYGGSEEIRLLQEIVLGVGGWRTLEALELDIDICHINEGHAAFVVLERARSYMKKHDVSAEHAWAITRAGNVFTTHTPVAAAFDRFDVGLIREYGSLIIQKTGIPMETLLSLGRLHGDSENEPFNMAYLAMRGCLWVNGVSALHGEVSRKLFAPMFLRWPMAEIPITHVTNGVHAPSWDSEWADTLWTEAAGKDRWLGVQENLTEAVNKIEDEALWTFRCRQRQDLVTYARQRYTYELSRKGGSDEELERAQCVLDPNALTLGFARRFTNYKRPNLLLRQPERLARILSNSERPVQIVVAGKAHPRDMEGKKMLQQWARFMRRSDVEGRAVLLEDYDISLAQEMVRGVDVWINTPRRPWEACGTSGMKVLVNGGLNLSEIDGWWAEAYTEDVGWAVGDGREEDIELEDRKETEMLFDILENEVVPQFYSRERDGLPRKWIGRMRNSMALLAPEYSANRMVREYMTRLYQPASLALRLRESDQGRLAREILAWQSQLLRYWNEIHFGESEVSISPEGFDISVQVHLGEIPADCVEVQLYADSLGGQAAECISLLRCDPLPGEIYGYCYSAQVKTSRNCRDYSLRVIPRFPLKEEIVTDIAVGESIDREQLSQQLRALDREFNRILWGSQCTVSAN
ncbi:alpha-glucan phosphorylase [Hahella sp. CCB-MM4]|uniref:alpha-glucan family phosphorylase n=1 Tax=Hahella sp. (strain CCB-MM4) TaxID=1926491 RepID=UPI000B9BA2A9|nr:alpha-glucan family phosphorylase [Hahella sp. CCB-MM4]OZG72915.1 alpha-glucan phosphorylase [Hahella sp. CCB-MM4]